jgi:hypothetical protein
MLRPYQQATVDWALNNLDGKPIAIAASTGYGKTHLVNGLVEGMPGRTGIITLSNSLVGQYIRTFPVPALIGLQHYKTPEHYMASKEAAKRANCVIMNPASFMNYMTAEGAVPFDNLIIDEADACLGLFRILNPTAIEWEEGLPVTTENIVKQLVACNKEHMSYGFVKNQNRYWWELLKTEGKRDPVTKQKTIKYTLKIHDVVLSPSFAKHFFPKNTIAMSGTMLPSFCKELFGTSDYHYNEGDSPIPIERRRIEAFTQAEGLAFPTDYADMADLLKGVLDKYPQRPAIVHMSYRDVAAMQAVEETLKGYQSKEDKMVSLAAIEGTEEVLCAPGAVEGLDLKDDKCRLNIVLRAGFPNKGADSVAKRLALPDGNKWYVEQTLRAAIQSAGRSTRGPDDYSITVIADCRLTKLIKDNQDLCPKYFLDACTFLSRPK